MTKIKEELKTLRLKIKELTDKEIQMQRIKQIYDEKCKQISELNGKKELLKSNIKAMMVKSDMDRESESKYAVEQAYFEVTKLTIEDLENVLVTIENSLVQFHSEKIEQFFVLV